MVHEWNSKWNSFHQQKAKDLRVRAVAVTVIKSLRILFFFITSLCITQTTAHITKDDHLFVFILNALMYFNNIATYVLEKNFLYIFSPFSCNVQSQVIIPSQAVDPSETYIKLHTLSFFNTLKVYTVFYGHIDNQFNVCANQHCMGSEEGSKNLLYT